MRHLVFIFILFYNVLSYGHNQSVVVGVYTFAPPFSTVSDNGKSFYGFHIDLMNSICKKLHLNCIYKAINLKNMTLLLNQGAIDVAFSPVPIMSTKLSGYLFSLPYLNSDAQFVSLHENKEINSLKDIKNKRIGVLSHTLYYAFTQSNFKYKGTIKSYPLFPELIAALFNKEVDVIILNENAARYLLLNNSDFKLIGSGIPLGEGYGLVALKKNKDLIHKINAALWDIEANGDYLSIYKIYFGN